MSLRNLRNVRGFFSDYYLGSVFGRGTRGRKRLSDRETDWAYRRFQKLYAQAEGRAADASACRERLLRPLLRDILGFQLGEAVERVHPLFSSAEAEARGERPLVAAYCGEWGEDLDTSHGASAPARQLERMLASRGLDYGLVLTGERLRLLRAPGGGPRGAFLEVGLSGLADEEDPESFAAFVRLFHSSQFVVNSTGIANLQRIEQESREHAERVSEDLKRAVFTAAESLVRGLIADAVPRQELVSATELNEAAVVCYRDAALTALYRILFILYAEARDPRLDGHQVYRQSYSIHALIEDLLREPVRPWPENRSTLWPRLLALFRIYDKGLPQITPWDNIPPRGGDFFDSETTEGQILEAARLPDATVVSLLLDLTTTSPRRGVGRERVSFRELDIESLGAVYEGLLEYEPRVARETTVEVDVQGRIFALVPVEVLRLCREKNLKVKGEFAIVAGTVAEALHPEATVEVEEDEDGPAEEDAEAGESEDEEEGEAIEAVKKGASARLVRRLEAGDFHFVLGPARKGSGSFYTPLPLVRDLVLHSLRPLAEGKTVAEIERLRILDPACGSAHFLVEAMRYLARELHHAYVEESGKVGPPLFRSTTGLGWDDNWKASDEEARAENSEARAWCKRRIAERCLFGVDRNPTAVALARVALWIESLAGDRPLTYFEHHVRCGNSLLGTWLDRLGEPPLPSMRPKPKPGALGLFVEPAKELIRKAAGIRRLIDDAGPDALIREGIEAESVEEQDFKEGLRKKADGLLSGAKLLFDLRFASAFLPEIWAEWSTLTSYLSGPKRLREYARSRSWWGEFEAVRERERFFHWELEFPEVLLGSERRGFDVVLGNPPWDKVLPTKHEFYARYDVLIRAYKGNDLEKRIRELHTLRPELESEFKKYRDRTTTIARVLRQGGDFPLAEARSQAAHEEIAKYFADRAARLVADGGAAGLVLPSVSYNGDGWVGFRRFLLTQARIERFYGFENRKKIFPIDSRYKFVNLVFRKGPAADGFNAAFMRHDLGELEGDSPKPWMVRFTRQDVERLSPETLAFLEYRGPKDREIVEKMYRNRPTLGSDRSGSWKTTFVSWRNHNPVYNSAEDKDLWTDPGSGRLFTPETLLHVTAGSPTETVSQMREAGYWPVFEGKSIDQHLVGVIPVRWWLSIRQAEDKYRVKPRNGSTLVFRETASNTNERTMIAAVLPPFSVAAHSLSGLLVDAVNLDAAATVLNSLCFDYALRFRTAGTHVSFTYVTPMPVPPALVTNSLPRIPTEFARKGLKHIANDRDLWPHLWEANCAVAEAYELTAADFEHVLASFPVFARKRPGFFVYLRERLTEWKTQEQAEAARTVADSVT